MSLLIAIPAGIASAIAYGASTAVEHSAANNEVNNVDAPAGEVDAGGLLKLIRNPRWLLGMAGDTLGLVLQVVAISTGPVVLIQPLLIFALPISLPIAYWLGGPKPGRKQYTACAWIAAGLAAFFVIVGNPGDAATLPIRSAIICVVVAAVAGLGALAAVRGRTGTVKAAIFGVVAGAWFGLVAVLLDAAAAAWQDHGVAAFGHALGLVPLIGLILLGGASIALTQAAFQVGALGASFPANLTADPVMAVVLGAALLHETVPSSPWALIAYAACLGAILYGAIRLAAEPAKLVQQEAGS